MEIKIFIQWYLVLFLLGIVGLPITKFLFTKWKDFGYGLAKFVGLFVVGMSMWFFASIKLIPFNVYSSVIFLLCALASSGYFIYKDFNEYKKKIKLLLIEEFLFFINIAFWTYIRGFNPRVEGTEKMMNIAFMNSINRSSFFPPTDPWYVGESINYYYIGHYLFTFIAKIAFVPISYAYNYALVTIATQGFVSLYSIIIELLRKSGRSVKHIFGILGALWISYGGNLHYIFNMIKSWLTDTEFTYFFPNATRIIPFAIDEFPAYSIVLGDVHGHYIGYPFFIIAIALIISGFSIKLNSSKKIIFNAVTSLLVFAMYGINSWGFITLNVGFLLLHLLQAWNMPKKDIVEKFTFFMIAEAALIVPGLILMLPYIFNFHPPTVGDGRLGFTPSFVIDEIKKGTHIFYKIQENPHGLSPFKQWIVGKWQEDFGPWLLMWGMFLFTTLGYFVTKISKSIKNIDREKLMLLLLIVSTGLIFGVEFIFFKDIFHTSNPPYYRTNTIFKFYYHAWVIWGIVSTWMAGVMISRISKKDYRLAMSINIPVLTIVFLMFIGSIVYMQKAIHDFYPVRIIKEDDAGKAWTMDGIRYISLEIDKQGDYEAIHWLNANVAGQPTIIEAVGDAYTYYARFSAYTGLPTVLGWPTHEWQWRGSSEIAFERQNGKTDSAGTKVIYGTTEFYESGDITIINKIINSYQIEYIIVGGLEREKYPNLKEEAIAQIGDIVYDKENTKIYKVR